MITYDSLKNKNKIYYAVYIPLHDGIPHYIVPLEINFLGFFVKSNYGRCLRVVSSTRSTEYICLVEDNAFIRTNMKPRNMLQLTAYQHSWLPKGKLYITDDKSLLIKPIRNFYREELHKGIRTARGTYQKVMNTLKELK